MFLPLDCLVKFVKLGEKNRFGAEISSPLFVRRSAENFQNVLES